LKTAASAPGKIILFGEHFVVYGNPALASSINLRARVVASRSSEGEVRLEDGSRDNPAVRSAEYMLRKLGKGEGVTLRTSSEIPESVGLGSSASVAAASAAATLMLYSDKLDLPLILEAAHDGERIIHYTPSGIDTSVAVFGGAGRYVKSEGYELLDIKLEELLVVNTGKRRKTGDLVKRVLEFKEKEPRSFQDLLEESKNLVEEALDNLRSQNLEALGLLMNKNQELLRAIGVSSREIEDVIEACLRFGAYGAKLTGAGGGGCVIAVADYDKLGGLADKLSRSFQVFRTRLGVEGVKVEPP